MQRLAEADVEQALACAETAITRETDPAVPGYALARHLLGTAYVAADRPSEAVPVLIDAWRTARALDGPPLLGLQAACSLALAQFNAGRFEQARQVCVESAPAVAAVQQAWGDAAALGIARLLMVEGRLALRDGDVVGAAGDTATLGRAVEGVGAGVPGGDGADEPGGGRARGRGSSRRDGDARRGPGRRRQRSDLALRPP